MNTLFGAIVVNSNKLSDKVWHFVFYEVLFPVFDNAGVRSVIAMRLKIYEFNVVLY